MQIVIEISEEEYKCVQLTGHIGNATAISNAILNGTPLPEHHGRTAQTAQLDQERNGNRCRQNLRGLYRQQRRVLCLEGSRAEKGVKDQERHHHLRSRFHRTA